MTISLTAWASYQAYLRLPEAMQSRRALQILRKTAAALGRFHIWQARESRVPPTPAPRLRPVLSSIHSAKYSAVRTDAPPA